jgi:hypothetical protein
VFAWFDERDKEGWAVVSLPDAMSLRIPFRSVAVIVVVIMVCGAYRRSFGDAEGLDLGAAPRVHQGAAGAAGAAHRRQRASPCVCLRTCVLRACMWPGVRTYQLAGGSRCVFLPLRLSAALTLNPRGLPITGPRSGGREAGRAGPGRGARLRRCVRRGRKPARRQRLLALGSVSGPFSALISRYCVWCVCR